VFLKLRTASRLYFGPNLILFVKLTGQKQELGMMNELNLQEDELSQTQVLSRSQRSDSFSED